MPQIEQSTLDFLSDLKYHNEREWFLKNRKRYDDAKKNFESFVQAVIDRISLNLIPFLRDWRLKAVPTGSIATSDSQMTKQSIKLISELLL